MPKTNTILKIFWKQNENTKPLYGIAEAHWQLYKRDFLTITARILSITHFAANWASVKFFEYNQFNNKMHSNNSFRPWHSFSIHPNTINLFSCRAALENRTQRKNWMWKSCNYFAKFEIKSDNDGKKEWKSRATTNQLSYRKSIRFNVNRNDIPRDLLIDDCIITL